MDFIAKSRSAIRILKEQGLVSLFLKGFSLIAKVFDRSKRPDESKIVFESLSTFQHRGVMVDVGAHYGGSLAPFAKEGWKIYAFEPDSANRKILVSKFNHFDNVTIDSRAVSDQTQKGVPFYRSIESSGISGLSAFRPSHKKNGKVDTTTLTEFFKDNQIDVVDFLKIDSEGFDYFVLKGIPWNKISPRVIVCEFENIKTEPLGYSFHDMAGFLENRGYKLIISEWFPIRNYGDLHDWRHFIEYPCELHDVNAWGNIIAARDQELFEAFNHRCRKFTNEE